MNPLKTQLTDAQKAAIQMAYEGFEVTCGPYKFGMTSGIKGLLYELNKGCNGGYVDAHYLREKLEQLIGAIEDAEQDGNPDSGFGCPICGEAENHDGEECTMRPTTAIAVSLVPTDLQEREAYESDGQPDEAYEWFSYDPEA